MVAFQWVVACNIWTHSWKFIEYWRFQPCFVHALSHCECSKIYPKLPKFAQRQNFEIPPKFEILVFSKNKYSICRWGTRSCFRYLDFQSKNFSYAIFIVKKWPLYVNFSIPPCGNWWFSHSSTSSLGMRFCGHVPNSMRNKNPKRLIPYLLEKVVFFHICFSL